jgi:hypothetical protein
MNLGDAQEDTNNIIANRNTRRDLRMMSHLLARRHLIGPGRPIVTVVNFQRGNRAIATSQASQPRLQRTDLTITSFSHPNLRLHRTSQCSGDGDRPCPVNRKGAMMPPSGTETTGKDTRELYIKDGGRRAASGQRPNRDTE